MPFVSHQTGIFVIEKFGTGGNITMAYINGTKYAIHTFTTIPNSIFTGSFKPPGNVATTCDYIVVGGGGQGAHFAVSCGGGAGGQVQTGSISVPGAGIAVRVGPGGSAGGGVSSNGSPGLYSQLGASITANGGAGGTRGSSPPGANGTQNSITGQTLYYAGGGGGTGNIGGLGGGGTGWISSGVGATPGTFYGAGGGGGSAAANGADGYAGVVIIRYPLVTQ